jgi:hypothetical protein
MGFLKWKSKNRPAIQRLPEGTFTVDRHGQTITSTVAPDFPREVLSEIAGEVLRLFRESRMTSLPLVEFSLHFGEFILTAREMQGGAIVFLSPKNMYETSGPTEFHA